MPKSVAEYALANIQSRLSRRPEAEIVDDIKSRLFPAQLDFVQDRNRYKALLCPRRSGKSYVAAAYLCIRALSQPGANCLYVTLTRGSARSILWTPPGTGLKKINDDFDLGLKFHNHRLDATFPNGSTITLTGADSAGEIDKLRGQAYDLVIIDECKSFPPRVITELIEQVLGPALADRMGSLAIIGTPGSILAGTFYEATRPNSKVSKVYRAKSRRPYIWSLHKWTMKDNTAMPHLWDTALADKERNQWENDTPIWQREYLGNWMPDDSLMVYRYDEAKNCHDGRELGPHGLPEGYEWNYLLGIDLGFDDDFAMVVGAYSENHPDFFQVWDFKSPHLIVPAMASAIKDAEKKFGKFDMVIGDAGGLGKTIFATLAEQYGIYVEPAEKTEKLDYIELLNSDLVTSRIKIRKGSSLEEEMKYLQFRTLSSGKKMEDPHCANHCCDAFLYLWRYSYHHFFERRKLTLEPGTKEWYRDRDAKELERAKAQTKEDKERDFFDEIGEGRDGGLDDLRDLYQ